MNSLLGVQKLGARCECGQGHQRIKRGHYYCCEASHTTHPLLESWIPEHISKHQIPHRFAFLTSRNSGAYGLNPFDPKHKKDYFGFSVLQVQAMEAICSFFSISFESLAVCGLHTYVCENKSK